MLKTKKSLRDSYADKIKNGEKAYKPLRSNCSLRDSYARKIKAGEKSRYVYKKRQGVRKDKAFSIFTKNLYKCHITNTCSDVHLHHIFGAANEGNSEEYGFIVPLSAEWHNMSDNGIHFDKALDLHYKRLCQDYWLENYGTKEEFIRIFGKWW